jgi:membrane protease YdiL (CAAX protease family)
MLPGYWLAPRLVRRWLPDRQVVGAIYGAALVFGSVHASVWPAPVPLFVLGLALGFLAHRTQSLVAPMVLHSLFNGVACVVLALSRQTPAP